MEPTKPWVTGAAFSATIAVVYVACALAVWLFPDGTLTFFNTWAHGIDLSTIKRPSDRPLSLNDWGTGFATAVVAGFLTGAIYGWAWNLFWRMSQAHRSGNR